MSMYLVDSTDMTAIANAIRQKDDTQTTMTVSDMPTRIQNIPTGGGTDYMAERIQGTLSSYTIPNTCTKISGYAFYSLPDLTSITIPASVTNIEKYAFDTCNNLITVTFNCTGCTSGTSLFGANYKLKTIVNFSGATLNYNIPTYCFSNTALEGDITLEDHCTVGNSAFRNNNSQGILYVHLTQTDASLLTSKYSFGAGTTTTTKSFDFDHCRLVVPVGMLSDYQSAFPNYSSIMMEETT